MIKMIVLILNREKKHFTMPVLREVSRKTILGKSGLSDYSLNCYGGCVFPAG
jgi:hypothetical protein